MVLPENLEIEYNNFADKTTKNVEKMNKMKIAPTTKRLIDAMYHGAYGVDIAAEREAAKRQIQVAKRKARLAEAKAKDVEAKAKAKAKETEAKANNAYVKIANFVRALRLDRTAEEIDAMADISIEEVNTILNVHPLNN